MNSEEYDYEDDCDPWCTICNPELVGTNYFDDLSDRDEEDGE